MKLIVNDPVDEVLHIIDAERLIFNSTNPERDFEDYINDVDRPRFDNIWSIRWMRWNIEVEWEENI